MTQWINDETFPSSIWNLCSKLLLTKMQQTKNHEYNLSYQQLEIAILLISLEELIYMVLFL